MLNEEKLFAGVDVGSNTAEACILDQDGNIKASHIIPVRPVPEKSAKEVFYLSLASSGIRKEQIGLCFSTGYGRNNIYFSEDNVSEISCHGRGAHFLNNRIRTIVDVGGQDCKVIRIDRNGFLEDFTMNDKCAAGAGRFLELMAKKLDVDISELGKLSIKSKRPVKFSSTCAIFAEIELLQKLYYGKKKKDIAAGIHIAMARRIKSLVGRTVLKEELCLTGGGSKNIGMVRAIEHELNVRFRALPIDPQLIGAFGAAIFARDSWFMSERQVS